MSTSKIPALIDALVTQCTTALPTAAVLDGYGVTDYAGDFLLIGADDPDDESEALTAVAEQVPGPMATTHPRDETGEINLVAHSWNGDGDQKAARNGVYAITNDIENLLRTNPSLGVQGVLWTSFGSGSSLMQDQDENGARAWLSFSIAFRARI